ncbi:MAG: M50 family metallopeptidase [Patescibacteria group bacterium]
MSLILFVIIIAVLVLIHELGHFIAAKKSGILVEEFGFGFPPRIWGKKIGETTYSINAIPLGGFVKLFGEEYEEIENVPTKQSLSVSLKKRAFIYKKPIVKTVVILAGVIMNTVLGVTIYYTLLGFNRFQSDPIPLISPYNFRFGTQEGRVIAIHIAPESPAAKAGISVEDTILRYRLNGIKQEAKWHSITSASSLIDTIKSSADSEVLLETENVRNGVKKIVPVVPYYNKELKRAIIGVNLLDAVVLKYQTPRQKILSGFMHSYNLLAYNYTTIGRLFQIAVKDKTLEPVSQTVSGPVGIYSIVNEIIQTSGEKLVKNILNVVGLLSLSLAAMNILPLPALDGGRLVFIIYEWIAGKPVNKNFERYVNLIGFFALISIGILVSINDIMRLLRL